MKKLLFVDDQWCRKENRNIYLAEFGELISEGEYKFLYETAEVDGRYVVWPVLKTIENNPEIEAVILDMNFGKQYNFGLFVLKVIKAAYDELPVIIMSSESRDELIKIMMTEGADDYLEKKPTLNELKEALRRLPSKIINNLPRKE